MNVNVNVNVKKCRLTPTVFSGRELTVCDETVRAELERPAREAAAGRGMGEMRGDPGRRAALPGPGPGALPAVWDIVNMALEYGPEYGVPCGYMSGDLLLTSQVPQGNLES